jgi:hypothetical protein
MAAYKIKQNVFLLSSDTQWQNQLKNLLKNVSLKKSELVISTSEIGNLENLLNNKPDLILIDYRPDKEDVFRDLLEKIKKINPKFKTLLIKEKNLPDAIPKIKETIIHIHQSGIDLAGKNFIRYFIIFLALVGILAYLDDYYQTFITPYVFIAIIAIGTIRRFLMMYFKGRKIKEDVAVYFDCI